MTAPNVVVLDVRLPDGNGIDLCRSILSAQPDTRCLILTAYDDDASNMAAVLAGASGYVLKDVQGRHLLDKIHRVAQGKAWSRKTLRGGCTFPLRHRTVSRTLWSASLGVNHKFSS